VIRRQDGNDIVVDLGENDVIIQAGVCLQIFSQNEFIAQAHKVVSPNDPEIGRMSVVAFNYP